MNSIMKVTLLAASVFMATNAFAETQKIDLSNADTKATYALGAYFGTSLKSNLEHVAAQQQEKTGAKIDNKLIDSVASDTLSGKNEKVDGATQAKVLGAFFAEQLKDYMVKVAADQKNKTDIALNEDVLKQAAQDALSGTSLLKPDEVQKTLQEFEARTKKVMEDKAKVEAEAKAAKAAKTEVEGAAFRTKFATEKGVIKTESGLLYREDRAGSGAKPKATDTVVVNYKGTLIDGTKFDSSYDRKKPATFELNQVIPGWTEGLQHMTVGSKYTLVIPPKLGYGDQDLGTIPANATLMFEVELLEIKKGNDVKSAAVSAAPATK